MGSEFGGKLPSWEAIVNTIESAQQQIVPSTPALDHIIQNSAAKGLPNIAIGPAQGQFLSVLCKAIGAQQILEVGTLGGYSTSWFANSSTSARVTSIEFNEHHRSVALENLQGVKDRVEIIHGAALDILSKLKAQGKKFDFVFIDADWNEQGQYFDLAVDITRSGGIVYVDNAIRNLTESNGREKESRCLVDQVQGNTRVVASLIPTVQTWRKELHEIADGFLIAYVN